MAITTKHFFARNGMFSQSGSHILCIIVHYTINDDVIKTKCIYEGCVQLTYIQYMRKSHNDYMHNAHMQHARAMHVCKMHTFCVLIFCTYFAYMQKKICLVLCIFRAYAQFFVSFLYFAHMQIDIK